MILAKLYIAFDGDNDIAYYYMMKAWKDNKSIFFDFIDSHELRGIRQGSSETSIKAGLRERMKNADIFVLLVGERTKYLYKFIRWEIELAKEKRLPCIVVNLNGKRGADEQLCPRAMLDTLAIHISFNMRILAHAVSHWPNYIEQHPNLIGSYHYKTDVYTQLGL